MYEILYDLRSGTVVQLKFQPCTWYRDHVWYKGIDTNYKMYKGTRTFLSRYMVQWLALVQRYRGICSLVQRYSLKKGLVLGTKKVFSTLLDNFSARLVHKYEHLW